MFARVCRVDGINHICFRDKVLGFLFFLFFLEGGGLVFIKFSALFLIFYV